MFKLSKVALGLAAVTGLSVSLPASAFVTLANLGGGAASIDLTVLDMGTTGYAGAVTFGTASTVCSGGTVALGISSCDTVVAPFGGSIGDVGGHFPGEDTWTVFRINSIGVGLDSWVAGFGGEYLTGMFYGSKDYDVQYDGGTVFTSRASGGRMDIYKWGSDQDPNKFQNLPGERTGPSSYNGGAGYLVTGTAANLWMSLVAEDFEGVFGCVGGLATCSTVNATTTAFLSVDPTVGIQNFNTDTIENTFAPAGSALVDFSLSGSPLCTNGTATCGQWTTVGNLTALGYRVPEPGSLALVGLGLFGLGALRRRKQNN